MNRLIELLELCSKACSGNSGGLIGILTKIIKNVINPLIDALVKIINISGLPKIIGDVLNIIICLLKDLLNIVLALVNCILNGGSLNSVKLCICDDTCGCPSPQSGSAPVESCKCTKENRECVANKAKDTIEASNAAAIALNKCEAALLQSITDAYEKACKVRYFD